MAYGRLHIYESPGNRQRLAHAHARTPVIGGNNNNKNVQNKSSYDNDSNNYNNNMIRSFSADGLGLLRKVTITDPHHLHQHAQDKESTPLLLGPMRTGNYFKDDNVAAPENEGEEDEPYDSTSPALSVWIVPALLCGLSYGTSCVVSMISNACIVAIQS